MEALRRFATRHPWARRPLALLVAFVIMPLAIPVVVIMSGIAEHGEDIVQLYRDAWHLFRHNDWRK